MEAFAATFRDGTVTTLAREFNNHNWMMVETFRENSIQKTSYIRFEAWSDDRAMDFIRTATESDSYVTIFI